MIEEISLIFPLIALIVSVVCCACSIWLNHDTIRTLEELTGIRYELVSMKKLLETFYSDKRVESQKQKDEYVYRPPQDESCGS